MYKFSLFKNYTYKFQIPSIPKGFELELTDGWYGVWSLIDSEMNELIVKKRVVVGSKLIIINAELFGLSEGRDPLEVRKCVLCYCRTKYPSLKFEFNLLGGSQEGIQSLPPSPNVI